MIYLNFDSGSAGTTVGGFTQNGGANFQYRAGAGGIMTTGGAGFLSPANDQSAVYNTGPSATDSAAQITQYMLYTSSGNWVGTGIVLNANAGLTTGYLFVVDLTSSGGNCIIYKNTGAGWNQVGATSASLGLTRADGTVYLIRAERVGTTLGMYVWPSGSSQPGSYTHSVTDGGTVLSAGYAGLRIGTPNASGYGQTLCDDFYVGIPSDTFTPTSGPTSYTLTGPSAGRPGVASTNFTATLNSAATSTVTITPSDGGAGGTFTPSTVSITTGNTVGTFVYTASSAGAKTISTSDDAGLTDPGSVTFTAYTLSLTPSTQSVANGVAATLTATLTPSGALSATTTAGTLSTSAPTSGAGFTLTTPSSGSGTATVTVTGPGGTLQTANVVYAPAAATAITWGSYPTAVPVGSASAPFNIAANGSLASSVQVTVTVTPTGGTVTSSPVTLASGPASTGAFTYTAAAATTYTVTITNNGGLTNPAPLTITATAVTILNFIYPAGISGLTTVGYTLIDLSTDTVYQAFTTSGVTEVLAGSGVYIANVPVPDTVHVACCWRLVSNGVVKYVNEFLPRS